MVLVRSVGEAPGAQKRKVGRPQAAYHTWWLNKDSSFLSTFAPFLFSAIVDGDADKLKEGMHKVDTR